MTIKGEISDQFNVNLHQTEEHRDIFAEARRLQEEANAAGMSTNRLSEVPSGAVVDERPIRITDDLSDLGKIARLGAAPNDPLRNATQTPRGEESYIG